MSWSFFCHNIDLTNYSCSSYLDYLAASGSPYSISFTTTGDGALAYPFTTYSNEPGKFRLYRDFISSPTQLYAWSPDGGTPTSSYFTQSNTGAGSITNSPDFCNGTIKQVACLNTSISFGPDALVPPYVTDNSWWGDHYSEFILAKHNFTGSFVIPTLVRNGGKSWQWKRISSNRFVTDPAYIGCNATISGGDVVFTITIESGSAVDGGVDESATLNVGPLADYELLRVAVAIETGTPYVMVDPARPTTYASVLREATITLWCRGQSVTLTKTQAYYNWDNTTNYNSIAPWYGSSIYERPYMFASAGTDATVSIASIRHGVIADGTGSEANTEGTLAWELNYQ